MQHSSAVPTAATTSGFNTPQHNPQCSPACRQDWPDSLPMSPVNCVCKQGKVSCHSQCLWSSPPIDLVCFLHPDLSPVPPHDFGLTSTTSHCPLTSPILPPVSLALFPHISIDSWSYFSLFCTLPYTYLLPTSQLKADRWPWWLLWHCIRLWSSQTPKLTLMLLLLSATHVLYIAETRTPLSPHLGNWLRLPLFLLHPSCSEATSPQTPSSPVTPVSNSAFDYLPSTLPSRFHLSGVPVASRAQHTSWG
jgi:hypothetical protein